MGNKALLSEAEIIAYLNRIMDSTFAKFIMKKLSKPKSISKSLAIYSGVEEAESIKEAVHAKVVATAIEKGAVAFGVESTAIKDFLKDPYMRKGFSVIIRGIAEHGITKPQKLSAPFLVVWNFTKFRGVKGAFDRTIAGLKNAKDAGLTVGLATTATHHNIDLMAEMVELARELRVDRVIVFSFVPTGRGREMVEEDLGPEEREDLMNYLYREWQKGDMQIFTTSPCYARISLSNALKNAGAKVSPTHFADLELPAGYFGGAKALTEFIGGCGAGRIYCSIEHNGDIQPCVFMPIKLGNVLKDGFQNVWDNSEVLLKLRDRDKSDYACSSCPFHYVCGGCRARAYAYYGDINAPDPGCIMQKAEWDKIVNRDSRLEHEEEVVRA